MRPEASGACRHLPAWQYATALLAALCLVLLPWTRRFRLEAGIMGSHCMRDGTKIWRLGADYRGQKEKNCLCH